MFGSAESRRHQSGRPQRHSWAPHIDASTLRPLLLSHRRQLSSRRVLIGPLTFEPIRKRMIWKGAFRSDPQNFRPETSQMAYSRLLPRGIASDGSFFKTAPSHSRLPMAAECGVYGVGWLPEVAAVTATVSRRESCRPSALWLVTHRGAKTVSGRARVY